ncbi:DNA primase [Jeotgalibaca sp. A127]|uniref:DNA primase n=1 Tax=Jeotgalibaca sp. A127 TaxID=3457324 RepID=UPI003FD4BF47
MATRIPEETINKIRSETNIVDIVSQYVQLKKRGKNYFGFCPFHDERTPSFSVTDEKQIFHCFSCGRGGNLFTFLMEVDGISFVESVKKAAEMSDISVNIDLDDNQPRSELQNKKDKLIAVHEAATAFYHQVLMNTVTGEAALDYLIKRGFTQELLQEYQIGFSPPDKTATQQILAKQNYPLSLLKETGIFSDRQDTSELLDRFAGRIIFPLRNEKGATIAFSGRLVPTQDGIESDFHEAKYLNSPETLLFSKRNFLFNLDKARAHMRKSSEVVLFEGYMDVISAWQAGIKNGVASMGTALTDEQTRILNKTVDSVVLCYDGDRAGLEATKKAIDLLDSNHRFDVSVFPMEPGMDPDDYIQSKGPKAFQEGITGHRESTFQFHARFLKSQLDLDSEKNRVEYLESMLRKLVQVESLIERELYLNELSEDFDIDLAVLKKQLQEYQQVHMKTKRQEETSKQQHATVTTMEMPVKQQLTKADLTERQLLNRLFHHEEAWHYLNELSPEFHFSNEEHQTIYFLYSAFREELQSVGHIDHFLDRLRNQKQIEIVSAINMNEIQAEVSRQEISDIITSLNHSTLQEQLKQKNQEMKAAARSSDKEKAKSLLADIIYLNRQLKMTKK